MHEQKVNYHHQKDNSNANVKVNESKEINQNVYNHYNNNQTKQRPQSEKMNKDMKRIQQEHYKQSLDKQIENEKKIRELNQERRNLNSAGIDQGDKVKGFPMLNSELDWNKREKERERLKKMEYNKELQRQIEEKNQIKEKEKQKRREEERKYESMFNRNSNSNNNLDGLQQKMINKSSDKLTLQSLNSISYNPGNIPMSNNKQLYSINEEPASLMNSSISLTGNNNSNHPYANIPHTQPHFYSNNTNVNSISNNGEMLNYPLSCPQQYLPNRPMTTYAMNYPQNIPMMMSDSIQIQNRTHNQPYYIPQPQPQQQQQQQQMGMPATVESLFHNFVNDQINVISDYESKVENFDDQHCDNQVDVVGTLTQEKFIAMERIKQEQDKISTCLGFYPMQNEYNNKITNLLNMILESKIEKIQQKRLIASTNNVIVSSNNIPVYNTQPEIFNSSVFKSNPNLYYTTNTNSNTNSNSNQIPRQSNNNLNVNISNNNSNNQLVPNISQAAYRSKYEDFVKQSIINADDVNPEFKQSLIGFSKFVSTNNNNISTINNNNSNTSSFLMQTWKENTNNNNNDTENYSIYRKNPNLSQIKEEEVKYNLPQSQILMTDDDDNANVNGKSKGNHNEENKDNNFKQSIKTNFNPNSLINNKDISAIIPSNIDYAHNNSNDKSNIHFDIINNNDISAIGEIGKYNESRLQMEDSLINGMKISKKEKDKTLIFKPQQRQQDNDTTNGNIFFNSYLERDNSNDNIFKQNITNKDNKILNDDVDDISDDDKCNISLSSKTKDNNKAKSKHSDKDKDKDEDEEEYHFDNEEIPNDYEQDNKKEVKENKNNNKNDEDDEYNNNEFENDKDVAELVKDTNNENNVNLEDYREIHESQKFEAKLNYFDDTINESSANIIKSSSKIINSQQKDNLKQSEMLNDSYGNELIKGLAQYHQMAFGNDKSFH